MELRDDFNKALHFTNDCKYISSSILANFLISYLGDLIGEKEKEMKDKIPDRWEVQNLL